jgi:hypothetical protein
LLTDTLYVDPDVVENVFGVKPVVTTLPAELNRTV